jgi:hypothetical protein
MTTTITTVEQAQERVSHLISSDAAPGTDDQVNGSR